MEIDRVDPEVFREGDADTKRKADNEGVFKELFASYHNGKKGCENIKVDDGVEEPVDVQNLVRQEALEDRVPNVGVRAPLKRGVATA